MTYEAFKEILVDHFEQFLPEEFAGAEISIQETRKTNDTVIEQLLIKLPNSNIVPVIGIRGIYDHMERTGRDVNLVMNDIAARLEMPKEISTLITAMTDPEYIRSHVEMRLINYELNEEYLQDKPYKRMDDFAVIYHLPVTEELLKADESGAVVVTNRMLENYKMDEQELHERAMANSIHNNPVTFASMSEILGAVVPLAETDEVEMYVLTNQKRVYGAAAILYEGVQEMIAEKIQDDYYVLPSSVHEVIILPASTGDMNREVLDEMIVNVNSEVLNPEDILGKRAYRYDAKEKYLELGADKVAENMEYEIKREKTVKPPTLSK